MKRFPNLAAMVLAGHIVATPARAGIADSPLPVLQAGATTLHLYSVTGVIDAGGGDLSTFFVCTSTDTSPQQVAVETFAAPGAGAYNNAAAESVSVAPGATVRLGTQWPLNFILGGVGVNGIVSAPGPGTSSARILSTSKKLVWTVFVGNHVNFPAQTSWELTIIAKTKQKAAN